MKPLRLAILDLYDGVPNQGMRCIEEIVRQFDEIRYDKYDVRGEGSVPDLSYDIYISTGGPGSPHKGDGTWDRRYYDWLKQCWEWNQSGMRRKKRVFFICHSFQMACKFFRVGKVVPRRSMSFGIFPVHKLPAGLADPLFNGLPDIFWAADFREWQVVQPDRKRLKNLGASLLAIEKERPHVPLERAVMAVRFSDDMIGVQFHPEADPEGMIEHFMDPKRRSKIIAEQGEKKYLKMMDHLHDSDKLALTHEIVLPLFLFRSIQLLQETAVA